MKFHDYDSLAVNVMEAMGKKIDMCDEAAIRKLIKKTNEYADELTNDDMTGLSFAHSVSIAASFEHAWYVGDRLYYKVWPDYIDMLGKTRITVPVHSINMPSTVFAVRFPVGHEPEFNGYKIKAFLSVRSHGVNVLGEADETAISVLFNMIQRHPKEPSHYFFHLGVTDLTETFDSVFARNLNVAKQDKIFVPHLGIREVVGRMGVESCDFALRLTVAIAFLASCGERYMNPDILNEDFKKYLAAVNSKNDTEADRLRTKARTTYNRPGYVIGRREHVLGKRAYRVEEDRGQGLGAGQQRKYRHYREAHIHHYWEVIEECPEWLRRVPRFIERIVVRPDLPLDPRTKGYRTLRTEAEMEKA